LKVSKCNAKSFSTSTPYEKAIWMMSRKWFLSRRIALRKNNLPSGRLKKDYDEVDEAMIQGVDGPCELIFCIQVILKGEFNGEANVNY
jgi:hypothetical protein